MIAETARGKIQDRTPVWLMRQAGRVLPQYRRVRASVKDFKTLVKTPELAAEVTIQPVTILDVDAAIIFSDILVVPEAMGLAYEMSEGTGPFFPKTIESEHDLKRLRLATTEDLNYVMEAIRISKRGLNASIPLIGFAGAPWTILAYMVEGSGSKTFSKAKRLLYDRPDMAHQLLDLITKSTVIYLKAQVKAGADIVQLFDSWAGVLTPEHFSEFSLRYIRRICDEISDVPKIVFARGANHAHESMNNVACEVVGLDWTMNIEESRKLMPGKVLQGNLDPCALYGSFESIREQTRTMLERFGTKDHIANLGHGLYPDTEVDKVKCFVDEVKEYSLKLRAVT